MAKGLQNVEVLVNLEPFMKKNLKKSHNARKTESEDPLGFFNIHSVAKLQKNWRGALWWEKNFEKSRTLPKKNLKGDPLVSSGIVCYAETFLVQFPGPTSEI